MGLFDPIWMCDNDYTTEKARKKRDKAVVAVEKMNNPAKLKEVALRAPNSSVAETACKRIESDEALTEIAIHARTFQAASVAAKRLNDPLLLVKVALEAGRDKGGTTAVSRITDQEALGEVACGSVNPGTREKALERIKDLGVVMRLIRTGNVRFFVLADRVLGDENLREMLFERFDAEAIAYDRGLSASEREAIFKAIAGAVVKLKDPDDVERALVVFGPTCPAGYYAEPVFKALERKKASIEVERTSGQLVLACKTCGSVVHYNEDFDTEDPNWGKQCWFSCKCGRVGGGPRRNGSYEEPSHTTLAANPGLIEGDVIHLCPSCLKLRASSPHGCGIPACTCREQWRHPLVVPFSPAVW